MALRVIIASWCGIGTTVALCALPFAVPHPFVAILALADSRSRAAPAIHQALAASGWAADSLLGHLHGALPAEGSKSNIPSENRPPTLGLAQAFSSGRAALEKEDGEVPQQSKKALGDAPKASTTTHGLTTNAAAERGTEPGETMYRAPAAARGQGLHGATTVGRQLRSREKAEEPSNHGLPALTSKRKTQLDSVERAPQSAGPAANLIRADPYLGRQSSASAPLTSPYPNSPPAKVVAPVDPPAAAAAVDKAANLSPLAAAALKRAVPASIQSPAPATPSGRIFSPLAPPRSAGFAWPGTAALERPPPAVAAHVGIGDSHASSLTMSTSQSLERPSRYDRSGVLWRAPAGGTETTGVSPAGSAFSEGGAATGFSAIPTTMSPRSPSANPVPDVTADPTTAVAAALLTGTVRRLEFDRCDRHTQKVTISVSPGDTIVVRCPNAAHTVPPDISRYCCNGSCARCTNQSAVSYATLYRMGSIPNFRYASGDGINMAWRLKIPESLHHPFPTLSVAWMGPAVLSIPVEAAPGASGLPVTTLVIRIERRLQPEDQLALLRSPGPAGECSTEEVPVVEKEVETIVEDDGEEGFYEETRFGLRRVSYAARTTKPYCPVHFFAGCGGSVMKGFLLLMEPLCYIPWTAVFSSSLTVSVVLR